MPAKGKPLFDPEKIAAAVSSTLGDSIRGTFIAYLGDPTTQLVEVSIDQADHAGTFYIHGISAQNQSITGNEADTTDDKQYVTTALMTPNTIPPSLMIYGTPVRIKKINGVYVIDDLDGIPAAEYLYGIKDRLQRSVDISQFDFGLIRPSNPLSFKVIVSGARYYLDGVAYDVPTLESDDWISEVPAAVGMAKAIQVKLNPTIPSLSFVISAQFENNVQHSIVFGNYPKTIELSLFSCGWVKIYNGQKAINVVDIYAGQEILNKISTAIPTPATFFPLIVSAAAEVVVDDDGNVVWSED